MVGKKISRLILGQFLKVMQNKSLKIYMCLKAKTKEMVLTNQFERWKYFILNF